MANESLRHDVLHLSDDDFGSKHGRDRTAKETAARNANETAGYKAAEADAKKMEDFADKRSSESKAAAEQRMKEYKEGNAKSMEQFNANMQKIGTEHDAKMEKASRGGGGGAGIPKVGPKKPTDMKKGGKVSSASKRADGCCTKGKTKGRMI
jgi:arginyl-tRNA synthetase